MSASIGSPPLLVVRCPGTERSLAPGHSYVIGRDPSCDIVIADARVSSRHAVLRSEDGQWVLEDGNSTNGTFAENQRVNRFEIRGTCLFRLGHPSDGPIVMCTVRQAKPNALSSEASKVTRERSVVRQLPVATLRIGRAPDNDIVVSDPDVSRYHAELRNVAGAYRIVDLGSVNGTFANGQRVTAAELADGDFVGIGSATFRLVGQELQEYVMPTHGSETGSDAEKPRPAPVEEPSPEPVAPPAESLLPPAEDDGALEIPYAIRWLVPKGERFANFDILNDNDTQLDYYRRFGHIYAVGIPTKKYRLVVVSDPELLDAVAANEEQFGKRVEEINFFAQLSKSRGGGISVIGDGQHYSQVRRVMLPWYAPMNQRTQLPMMQEQARKLVAAWSAIPEDRPIDARAWIERYTLEVSGRGACKYDFGLLDGSGDPRPFAIAVPASTKESIRRVADPRPDFTAFAGRAARARRKTYLRDNKELFSTADALVRGRQNTCPVGPQTDLLSRLVTTPDPETGELLDTVTVRDQILMHLSNGFNGPAITGGWLAYVLATHPDVEEKMIAEIDGITGHNPDYELTYDDLLSLLYTTQVIKETLRIYPPLPVTIRRSLKDGMLGRYHVRKGDIILVGTLAAQRDPRYWGPEPDRFDPEQFAIEKVVDRPRHAFIPFSIGIRQCMAQEVTFMMLRVLLCVIYTHYRLRLAPGATVAKNTVVTTKPDGVPVIRLPRELMISPKEPPARREAPMTPAPAPGRDWGPPTEIPEDSAYRHLVIAYGSNFGANRELAERFAERSHFHGYTSETITLNELAEAPSRTQPWLLVVMTSTYTSNPPSNATKFKALLERSGVADQTWRNCRYVVWGLGNSQWNAFLAFPRYVHSRLSELGATPVADFAYADVGSPVWERQHSDWNGHLWPVLLELSGARYTDAAAARAAAEDAAAAVLTGTDSNTAMHRSLRPVGGAPEAVERASSVSSIMRLMSPGARRSAPPLGASSPSADRSRPQLQVLLVPTIRTNAVEIDTFEARVLACAELQSAQSPKRTRHLELSLPPGLSYRAGDHLGVCPKNNEERVEKLARHLGAELDGLLTVPKTLNVRAVPKGTVLQVRNVLTNLVDIAGRPSVMLLELLLEKASDGADRARLMEIWQVLQAPDGRASSLRDVVDAGGYSLLTLLDEFRSCSLNIFEFLQVAQPLRPRYYSTSSSPHVHGDGVVHITVGLEAASVPGMPTSEFRGMSSGYLHSLREGDRLNVFLESADGFHLQADVTKPMIFVSAGTGLAPMRAFCWERLALKNDGASLGEAALFNGIRSASLDYIYRDEIARFAEGRVLDHVHIATSRDRPGVRDYVQDRIREQGALVWRLLSDGGCIYVCGSQSMRAEVRDAFVDVAAKHGTMPRAQADAYLAELETTDRYRPDLWG
jgi:cytochrome P450 / NADPH-cytochrome P450 reductase